VKESWVLLVSICGLCFLTSCGGGSSSPSSSATHFSITAPASATPGMPFSFTVMALDASNSMTTRYSGTAHFTSSDGKAILPPNSTLTNGTGTFSATLKMAGGETITATDMATTSITGTSSTINVTAAGATHLSVMASSTAASGMALSFTVTALNASNNLVTSYSGTLHFTSTDGQATLPANSTLTNGTANFSATLKTSGIQTITATDTVTASITGTSNLMNVSAPGSLAITSGAPPDGTVGTTYGGSHSLTIEQVTFSFSGWPLTATGGMSDYHWSWSATQGSSLPPGLNVTVLTLLSGGSTRCCVTARIPVIGGTPTTAGTYHVIVTVSDSESPVAHVSVPYTIAISNSPSAAVSPASRELHIRYKLVDLGTLGGPNSNPALPFFEGVAVPSLSQLGTFAGQAENSTPDPFNPNCFNVDCYVSHAIKWQSGIRTDLGALPGPAGLSSAATWISDNGLIVGFSENGEVDPFTGIQSVHGVVWNHEEILDLGTLKGGYESIANAVNRQGQIVGYANNAVLDPNSIAGLGSQTRAVAWSNGRIYDLGTLGGTDAVALYVNARGLIVGESYTSSSVPPQTPECGGSPLTLHAFIWENGQMTDLKTLGGSCASAFALNNRGQVVGGATIAGDAESHAFLWERGVMKDLGTLGGTHSYAGWLNDSGQVVGAVSNQGDKALLASSWKDGAITNLGTLAGDTCSAADAINSQGQIVGGSGFFDAPFFSACTDPVEHAVLWESGKVYDLNLLATPSNDLTLSEATFINDRGEISGFGTLPSGDQHAFLLIPCGQDEAGSCREAGDEVNAIERKSTSIVSSATTAIQPNGTLRGMAARIYGWPVRASRSAAVESAAATTTEPAPTNLTSFAFSRGFEEIVRLTWTNNSKDSDSYYVESCAGSTCTNFSQIAKLGANATTYMQYFQFVHAITLRYRVRAHGPGGYSAYSNIRTQTLP
jgi:probable HAF family extracellular repeat protein